MKINAQNNVQKQNLNFKGYTKRSVEKTFGYVNDAVAFKELKSTPSQIYDNAMNMLREYKISSHGLDKQTVDYVISMMTAFKNSIKGKSKELDIALNIPSINNNFTNIKVHNTYNYDENNLSYKFDSICSLSDKIGKKFSYFYDDSKNLIFKEIDHGNGVFSIYNKLGEKYARVCGNIDLYDNLEKLLR